MWAGNSTHISYYALFFLNLMHFIPSSDFQIRSSKYLFSILFILDSFFTSVSRTL